MKKYILLSLFIHIGIASALISWSGASISEWTQSLLDHFGTEKIEDEFLEIQEEPSKQITPEQKPTKKKTTRTSKKKKTALQKPKPQLKPAVQKTKLSKRNKENFSKKDIVKNKKNSDEDITKKEKVNLPVKPEIQPNPKAEDPSSIKKAHNLEEQIPEVKYNSEENLNAIEQESSTSSDQEKPPEPSSHGQINSTPEGVDSSVNVSDKKIESIAQNTTESSEDRNFEEIKTNPQDLKQIIKESSSEKEIKSSQALVPVPGNPEWAYPQQARQNKNEGSVFLQYFVDDTGFVDKIQLLKSSGYSLLDNEALRVMARQRYQPGQSGWYRHRVDFKLKNM